MVRKRIEIVLPVWNELASLAPLVESLDAATCELRARFQVTYLFINDGSSDGTRTALQSLCDVRPDIRAIHLIHNFGHSAAIRCGLEHAQGDAVVLMDADLQDSPEALPQMIARWEQGADTVVAVRGQREEQHRWRFQLFYYILNRLSPGHPPFGTYCVLDRAVVRRLLTLKESNRYFPALVRFASESIATVIVDRKVRRHGNSRVGGIGLLRLAITAFLNASEVPVRMASLMGAFCTLLSLAAIGSITGIKLFTAVGVSGWAFVVAAIFFASGVQLLCLGVLGEYVSRIHHEIKQRPAYFVDTMQDAQQDMKAA
jgi:dolichol-phosphate mannosyltransferase